MTTTTAPKGKAIASLVKAYASLVSTNEAGIRAWYRSAVKVSVRDFEATIDEATKAGKVAGITKNSAKFVPVIVRAFDIEGADEVKAIEICKVAEMAQRALKSDGALALADKVGTWAEFKEMAELARDSKPKKNNTGAGRKAGEVEVTLNADGLISQALEGLRDLVDVTVTDFDSASELIKLVNSLVANSRAMLADSVERHPAKGKKTA